MISNRAQFLSQKIKLLSFQIIKGKLAHYILQLNKNKDIKWITVPVSQKDLAELFSVTRPALGRAIIEMNDDGYIEEIGKNIRIIYREKLMSLLK